MPNWAVTFLVMAIISGVLGLSGMAGAAPQIGWMLLGFFLIVAGAGFVAGRRPPLSEQEKPF